MNCLCCGKPIKSQTGAFNGWHRTCIRRFFGTSVMPEIHISSETLELLATETTSKGYTVPGVQKKLPLHLSVEGKARLTLVGYPSGYILKPQTQEYRALPEAEQMVMCMADAVGISTVPHGLIQSDGTYAYITKRVDRQAGPDESVRLLAMEDFCQLTYRLTADKYHSSYERCAKVIDRWSCQKGLDMAEFFMRVVFSFLVGNSDMHLKNFSLIETAPGAQTYKLAPAYDMLPVNVISEDTEETALALNGKKTRLRRKDFMALAAACQLPSVAAEKMIARLVAKKDVLMHIAASSPVPEDIRQACMDLIEMRVRVFTE